MSDFDDVLDMAHYGVKGMHWGQHKAREKTVTVTAKGKKLKTSGGFDRPATPDAKNAAKLKQKAKASGVHSLTNKDLKLVTERMRLEQQFGQLNAQNASVGKKLVAQLLGNAGKQELQKVANSKVSELGASIMKKTA